MQAQELLAWHQPASKFAFGASQAQDEALLIFVPPLAEILFLLAVWEGGTGLPSTDADCPRQHVQQACKQQ